MPALVPHPAASSTWGVVPHLDPVLAAAADEERAARAADALSALAARARAAAAVVSAQVEAHRHLLGVDWHGTAAAAFQGAVVLRTSQLHATAGRLEGLADEASRRAQLVTGGAW